MLHSTQWVGVIILATTFAVIFGMTVWAAGFWLAMLIWGAAIVMAAAIIGGMFLAMGGSA